MKLALTLDLYRALAERLTARAIREGKNLAAGDGGRPSRAHLYIALLGALEVGLVRTVEDALTVLRHASRPLGPMGKEWLEAQERELRPPEQGR